MTSLKVMASRGLLQSNSRSSSCLAKCTKHSPNFFRAFYDNDFSYSSVDRDLAIIELSSAVRFTDRVSPICLPDKGKNYDAELVTVAGWGKLGTSQGQPRILQKVVHKLQLSGT